MISWTFALAGLSPAQLRLSRTACDLTPLAVVLRVGYAIPRRP
jgi:hypothetical protein